MWLSSRAAGADCPAGLGPGLRNLTHGNTLIGWAVQSRPGLVDKPGS